VNPRLFEPISLQNETWSYLQENQKRATPTQTTAATPSNPSGVDKNNTSNHLESTGSASPGATATLQADTSKGHCEMSNDLSVNQQASWDEYVVSTCCTSSDYAECWYRVQASVDAKLACVIPKCQDLQTNDPDKMLGFKPLSGSNGQGKYQNLFPILILSSALRHAIPHFLIVSISLGVSLLLLV